MVSQYFYVIVQHFCAEDSSLQVKLHSSPLTYGIVSECRASTEVLHFVLLLGLFLTDAMKSANPRRIVTRMRK